MKIRVLTGDPFEMRLTIACTFCIMLITNSVIKAQSAFDKMTNEKMGKILLREVDKLEGQEGFWEFNYKGSRLVIITDEHANRMRIVSPVIDEKDLKKEQYRIMLEANFDKALDAKYSLYQGKVWSIYTHPLGELTVEQFKDAMAQVATLSTNFGGTYASGFLQFGNGN